MPRRRRAKRSNVSQRVTKYSKRVNRYPLYKRLVSPSVNISSLIRQTQKLVVKPLRSRVHKSKPSTKSTFKYDPYILRDRGSLRQISCYARKKHADLVRKRAFFRSRGLGGSSVRPEHNRKHKRC